MDNYEFIKSAGRGAFGTVIIAKDRLTNRKVAIKRINLGSMDKLSIVREVSSLRCLHHMNVVKYLDCCAFEDVLAIITEVVNFTMADVIWDKLRPKTEDFLRWFAIQLIEGVAYMHKCGIMHRDLKPENILITDEKMVKITDFGQACIIESPGTEYDLNVATRWYRAPELLFGYSKYDEKVDVWSVGCILAELSRGRPIFAGRTELEQISLIFGTLGTPSRINWPDFNKIPDASKIIFQNTKPIKDWRKLLRNQSLSDSFCAFLKAHLSLGPSIRTSSRQLREHKWLREKLVRAPHNYTIHQRHQKKTERTRKFPTIFYGKP